MTDLLADAPKQQLGKASEAPSPEHDHVHILLLRRLGQDGRRVAVAEDCAVGNAGALQRTQQFILKPVLDALPLA